MAGAAGCQAEDHELRGGAEAGRAMPGGTLARRWDPEVALLTRPGQVSCSWPCRYQSPELNPGFGAQAWSGRSLHSLIEWQSRLQALRS